MKRLIAFSLLALFTLGLSAQMPRTPMERLAYQGVKFERVLTHTDNVIPVNVKVGKHSFDGTLMIDGVTLSDDEIVKVIKDVWAEMDRIYKDDGGFSQGFFSQAEANAAKYDLGDIDWPFVISQLCTMGSVIPGGVGMTLGVAGDIVGLWAGQSSAGEAAISSGSSLSASYLSESAKAGLWSAGGNQIAGTAGKMFGGINFVAGMYNFGTAGKKLIDYFDRKGFLDEGDPMTQVLNDQMKIEDFYWRVNRRLYRKIQEKGKGKEWHLDIDAYSPDFDQTLFSCSAPQLWHCEAHLKRVTRLGDKSDVRDWQGTYQGSFSIKITHAMDWFDKEFKNNVILNGDALPFKELAQSGYFNVHDEVAEMSDLYKELSSPYFTVDLKGADGTRCGGYEGTLKLGVLEDKTFVSINHMVMVRPDVGPVEDGKADIPNLVHSSAEVAMRFKHGKESNRRNLQVIAYDQNNTDIITFGDGVTWLGEQFHGNMDEVVPDNTILMTDRGIFAELGKKTSFSVAAILAKTPFK